MNITNGVAVVSIRASVIIACTVVIINRKAVDKGYVRAVRGWNTAR